MCCGVMGSRVTARPLRGKGERGEAAGLERWLVLDGRWDVRSYFLGLMLGLELCDG